MPAPFARTHLLSAALGIAAMVATGTPAKAQSAFDGIWSVQIVVAQGGACGSGSITYPIRIARGVVYNAGSRSFAIFGRVNRRGVVRVSISDGAQRANGAGRLSRFNGSGRWASSAGCSGYWTAARRG